MLLVQLKPDQLGGILAKQGFRSDAKTYGAPTKKYASQSGFNNFAKICNATMVDKLKANLRANQHTTVNERAAVNSMLVLNKIRTVSFLIVCSGVFTQEECCTCLLSAAGLLS